MTGDRSETIDDVLMHGFVSPVASKREADSHRDGGVDSTTTTTIPTILAPESSSMPVTPIPREKQRPATTSFLSTPSTPKPTPFDSPAGVSPRRRLPGWMSPGA